MWHRITNNITNSKPLQSNIYNVYRLDKLNNECDTFILIYIKSLITVICPSNYLVVDKI